MKITITDGVGEGPTELAAFDKALLDAGIANYNLIKLSSIIPENSEIIVRKLDKNDREFGYRLYLVLSRKHEERIGKSAVAGLGWVQEAASGKGLFVEHCGESDKEVITLINNTLNSMKKDRQEDMGEISHKVKRIICKGQPVCSIVAAVYQAESWRK